MEQNFNLNVIPTSNARRNLVFLSEYQILYVREVREANSEANAVCPRSLDEVYPELALSSSKGEVEGLGMTLLGILMGRAGLHPCPKDV